MATILNADQHSNENTETSIESPSFEVILRFEAVDAKDPLAAAKKVLDWIEGNDGMGGAAVMIYEVNNELNGNKFTVDLSENDDEAVLPND